jgi:hypothetical protein
VSASNSCPLKIEDQILAGLEAGVLRHWRYAKEFLHIKPEYLLTVAVADALSNGFASVSGIDVAIRLEEPTKNAIFTLMSEAVGLQQWVKGPRPTISRKGKIDIFVSTEKARYAVELKGFDPSSIEVTKDLVRLQELLAINNGNNKMVSGHVAFPTQVDQRDWIQKHVNLSIDGASLRHDIKVVRHETGEDPEDGIPCYFANCISIFRK